MTGQLVYSLFNLLGIGAAFLVSRQMSFESHDRLAPRNKTAIYLGLVTGVVIGAKLPVMASYGWSLEYFVTGKSIYGALIGAFIGINTAKYSLGMKGSYGDRFIVPLCAAVAFGKTGCFFNGCCGGIETDSYFAIINGAGASVHPTQVYSLLFHLALGVFFYFLHRKHLAAGLHFTLYMLLYSMFRFLIEFIRTEPKLWMGFSAYQLMAISALPFFIILLFRKISTDNHGGS